MRKTNMLLFITFFSHFNKVKHHHNEFFIREKENARTKMIFQFETQTKADGDSSGNDRRASTAFCFTMQTFFMEFCNLWRVFMVWPLNWRWQKVENECSTPLAVNLSWHYFCQSLRSISYTSSCRYPSWYISQKCYCASSQLFQHIYN